MSYLLEEHINNRVDNKIIDWPILLRGANRLFAISHFFTEVEFGDDGDGWVFSFMVNENHNEKINSVSVNIEYNFDISGIEGMIINSLKDLLLDYADDFELLQCNSCEKFNWKEEFKKGNVDICGGCS